MKLYIIRHAESEANKQRIMASRLPFPLTDEGKNDAKLIASQLKEIVKIDKIISSPLIRAEETASFFCNEYKLTPDFDIRLAEQDLGIFSGMTYDEVKIHPLYENETLKRWNWKPEGNGESYSDIADRVVSFFSELNPDTTENVLIVTHAVTFRLIRSVLENTLPEFSVSFPNNGEIWEVDFKGLGHVHSIKSLYLGNSINFVHNP